MNNRRAVGRVSAGRISRHVAFANVTSVMALVIALGGTSYALVVSGKNIKNGTIRGIDIRNASLAEQELNFEALNPEDVFLEGAFLSDVLPVNPDAPETVIDTAMALEEGQHDLLLISTLSIRNPNEFPVTVTFRPTINGKPHGEHSFTEIIGPETTDISSVSFVCNGIPSGDPTQVGLYVEVSDDGAIEVLERSMDAAAFRPIPNPPL